MLVDSGAHPHHRGLAVIGPQSVSVIPLSFASNWFRAGQVTQFYPLRHEGHLLGLLGKILDPEKRKKGEISSCSHCSRRRWFPEAAVTSATSVVDIISYSYFAHQLFTP